jgi:hypothetical protein
MCQPKKPLVSAVHKATREHIRNLLEGVTKSLWGSDDDARSHLTLERNLGEAVRSLRAYPARSLFSRD